MVRTKQVNNENGAVLNRDFPRRNRSRIMVPEELRRLYPNTKPEHIEMALERSARTSAAIVGARSNCSERLWQR